MRKSVLFLSLALITGMTATARSLSPSEALQRVTGQSVSRSAGAVLASEPVMTVGSAGTPALYVFNKPEGGWMIVSADDVAAPVIGFSDSGAFDPVNIPDNLRGWLELCSEEILSASAAGAEPYVRTASHADSREQINPLVGTWWDQGSPYNNFCPLSSGRSTYTGCVATAMAQIMKYHNWPDKAGDNASFSYSWNGETISADFSNFEFDWANMSANYYYGYTYTQAQTDAVAKLMQACGYSLRMRYGSDASAAYSEQVGNALVTYFRYDAGIHNEFRNYYSSSEWENMIYENLKNVGPMVYWGGAHCFVCDGYRPDGYFHFNWGWSGMSDGYFLLSMLKPTNLGTGAGNGDYTNNQGALLGIKPSDGTDSPRKYTFCIDELTQAYPGSGTYFNILGSFVNRSPYTVTGQFVYQIYNADGTQKVTSVTVDAQVPRNWGIDIVTGMTRSATQMQGRISGLADGTYRLYPAVLVDGVEYPFQSPATIAGYVLITSSNGKITDATIPSPGELVAENLDTNGDFFVGSDIKISGTARFTGDGDTNATVKAVLLNADMSVRAYSNENYTLNFTPESTDFEFISSWFYDKGLAVEPGEYKFGIAISENGLFKVLGSCPVTVNARVPKPTFKTPVTVSVDNADAVDPMNIKINLSVEGLTGVVYRDFRLSVFKVGVFGAAEVNETLPIYVSAGQTTTESITISMRGAIPGERYFVHALVDNAGRTEYVTDTDVNKRVYFTIGNQSGISDVEVDEDAPVEYFNLQGMPVGADNLTPGVYIRRQGSKVAKILVR